MPRYQLDGIEVWFGTPDAPAPAGLCQETTPEITVGVSTSVRGTIVSVQYRRKGGPWKKLVLQADSYSAKVQYFTGQFSGLPVGIRIEYEVYVRVGGTRPKPEQQVGEMIWFEIAQESKRVKPLDSSAPEPILQSLSHSQTSKDAPSTESLEESKAMKSARIAKIPVDAAHRLAKITPNLSLLGKETLHALISEGTMEESHLNRLSLASILLDLANGNEDIAGKVVSALGARGVEKPQDLINMTNEEITSALEKVSGFDHDIATTWAANLKATLSRLFPNEVLVPSRIPLSLHISSGTSLPGSVKTETVEKAWKNNAGLDLLRMDISKDSIDRGKLNLSGLNPSDQKAFIRDIQVRKGAIRASGNTGIAEKLLKNGILSPALVSPSRLASTTGISPARATNIHERDIKHFGRLSQGLFTLIDAYSGGLQNTAVGNLRRPKVVDFVQRAETGEIFEGLDNIQKLFGDLDSCNCKHCNSILGPAAYFVDLMHFIETHVLNDDVVEGDAPFNGKQNHKLHLKTRRPDLWVLPLTCENTDTEIPQLQITDEIFENFIAQKHGIVISADRREVISAVYGDILPLGRHSVLQPTNLPIEEMGIYLSHFQLNRSDIAEILNEPEDVQLRAVLGISNIQSDLIAMSEASSVNIYNKLGLSFPPDDAKKKYYDKFNLPCSSDEILPMRDLLNATRLSRNDLGELVESRFVGGGTKSLTIKPEKKTDESVQNDIEFVLGVTLDHLDRIHRFLRLQRYFPMLPKELDGLITALGGKLDRATIADIGRAAILMNRFKAKPHELCAFAGEMPNDPIIRVKKPEDKDLTPYDILFNASSLMREEGAYPDDTIRYSANETSGAAQEHSMRLRAGLGIDDGSLTTLIEGLADALKAGSSINATINIRRLFMLRIRTLPRLALPPSIFPKLAQPLQLADNGPISFSLNEHNLSLLYRHAVLARWLKLGIADLLTLIRLTPGVNNHVSNLQDALAVVRFYDWWKKSSLSLEDLSFLLAPIEAMKEKIEDLWSAIQAWLHEQDQVSLTDTFLTQVEGITEEMSRKIMKLNSGKVFDVVGNRFDVIASSNIDDLDLTPIKDTQINSESIRQLVNDYHPNQRLPKVLTESLKIDIDMAKVITDIALAGNHDLSSGDFLVEGELKEALKPALMTILRLHHLGGALRISSALLSFYAKHQPELGISTWVEPNSQALRRIVATQALLKKHFRDDSAPAFAQMERVVADRNILSEVAIILFGLEPQLVRSLVENINLPENIFDALFKIEECAKTASLLSINAASLKNIANEDYAHASMAARALIAGFRAKYPEEKAWKERVEPYEERVLEKKRDALIDYLLHGPDAEFPDANEIYKYFLIDAEVEGCFRTSRVVAACSSLQLYIHRIRMNLEKESGGGLIVQPSLIPEEEWEWRQHYRVWEANRKIFLWPENYLDPTIRDDKTPLFEELESELLQQEISEQTVIDAYSNYLKRLEELANLRYAGAYHHYIEDEDSGEITDIIYLFGATGGEAPTHYWREIRNLVVSQEDELTSSEYGPWRKVETRIPSRHVSPVVYNGQLYVFWNEITTTSRNVVDGGKSSFIGYSHRYTLKFTSLRLDGQWTPPESISLKGAAPTFEETDSSIDDPLAEKKELEYFEKIFDEFYPYFGIFADSDLPSSLKEIFFDMEEKLKEDLKVSDHPVTFDEAINLLITPRFGLDVHTKAREGYTLGGFMWERPYLSVDPSYGNRLLVNCAGLLVRGAVDLFDRQVIRSDDTSYKWSDYSGSQLLAYRWSIKSWLEAQLSGLKEGLWNFSLLRRDSNVLWQTTWSSCPFDYRVAAELALNAKYLTVFTRHWGKEPEWSREEQKVANMSADAGVWAVAGSPGETVIETENELFLLLPNVTNINQYVLHRLGTTLVKEVARKLFTDGVDGLLSTSHQLGLSEPIPEVSGPGTLDKTIRNPIANDASYGIYFQEIFQHIPLIIAHYLNAQGKFEQAQHWYHYVFDPTSPEHQTDAAAPETDRNWKYRQFRGQEQTKLRNVLTDAAAIQKYRENPLNAHAIARLRVSAYQKAVVMRYIDNLLDWADESFTRFQMETVNEAMMLYVTAAEILGPRPLQLGECGELSDCTRTYDKLKGSISKDGEFLLEVEELIPQSSQLVSPTTGIGLLRPVFGLKGLLAFPLSKAAMTSRSTGPSTMVDGKSLKAAPLEKAPQDTTLAFGNVVARSDTPKTTPAASTISTSKPMKISMVPSGSSKRSEQSEPGLVPAVMKVSDTTEVSKGITGSLVHETALGKGGISEVSDIARGGLVASADTLTKVAQAHPYSDEMVGSFAFRQQFKFLGDRWRLNGGRHIPPTLGDRFSRAVVRQICAAFCIPRNEILEDYWNRVEDRIQKIRTCRDITGRKRKLSLFAPSIDPILLARARAAGIALDDAIGAFEGMIPLYRFSHLLQKAKEFASTVLSFGSALQSALERKDAEELVHLQTIQQQQIFALTTKAKEWELESTRANLGGLELRKIAVENRQLHYAGLLEAGLNEWEVAQGISTHTASVIKAGSATLAFLSGSLGLLPDVGSPFAMKYGGSQTKEMPAKVATGIDTLGDIASLIATSAALEAGWDRRNQDWIFQRDQSKDELSQIEKQIEAAEIARDLAEHAIKLHERNIKHNEELLEYHEDKFSGLGLYTWLASQLQRTYREAYNMAYRMARYAEQAYRFEREDYTAELLTGQYWEPLHAGLLAGNRLTLELQYLEQRYIETDQPKRELADHIFSLRQWDPKALIELRQKGECKFKVPELFFDLISPGDYRRRLRSVRVTIPAVAGPYVNVVASVSLDGSQMRYEPTLDIQDAPRPRTDSIATSSARNDAGAFEVNFRGEKYVPFEGAGAISEWSLSLPTPVRMFDYNTISDVILHLDYTASFDGQFRDVIQGVATGIVTSVQERLASDGITRTYNLKEEFPTQYLRLLNGEAVEIEVSPDHLPFFLQTASAKKASLVFTDLPDEATLIGDIEFNSKSIGTPTKDDQIGGFSIPLSINGAGPWNMKLRIQNLRAGTQTYLVFGFTAS